MTARPPRLPSAYLKSCFWALSRTGHFGLRHLFFKRCLKSFITRQLYNIAVKQRIWSSTCCWSRHHESQAFILGKRSRQVWWTESLQCPPWATWTQKNLAESKLKNHLTVLKVLKLLGLGDAEFEDIPKSWIFITFSLRVPFWACDARSINSGLCSSWSILILFVTLAKWVPKIPKVPPRKTCSDRPLRSSRTVCSTFLGRSDFLMASGDLIVKLQAGEGTNVSGKFRKHVFFCYCF